MARKKKSESEAKKPTPKRQFKYPGKVKTIRQRDDGSFMIIVETPQTRFNVIRQTYIVRHRKSLKLKEGQIVAAGEEIK